MNWWLLIGLTVVTFSNRFAFLAKGIKYQPGTRARKFLSYSSFAILTAIWTPIMFEYSAADGLKLAGMDYLFAGLLAAVLSFMRIRNIYVVLASTGVFFLLRLAF